MNSRLFLAAVLAATMTFGAWLALRPPELAPIPDSGAVVDFPAPGGSRATKGAGVAALPSAPNAAGAAVRPQFKIAPPPPTLFNEYLGARQYRILYDRVADSPLGQTPEGRLVLYEILRQCATITEGPRPGYRVNPPKREDFINNIPPADPQRERRIAAYDEFATDRCKGFEGTTIKHGDLMKLLNDSAAGGNPHAQALAMEQELWRARRTGSRPTLTDDQMASLQHVLATRDAEAIRVAGRIMANSWHDYSLRVGPDQLPVEQRAFVNAFLVLSCEYGAPCGADTPRMLEACALRGHCSAQNFPDYLYYYGSTPHDANMLMQYREIVRQAIETGNWSQLNIVRGVSPGGNRMTFVPGPR